MKLTIALITLIGLTAANPRPQLPTPDDPPPPLTSDPPPDSEQTPEPTTTSTSTSKDSPSPEPTRAPPVPNGAICECGYTYCASVLMGMSMSCRLNHQPTPLNHQIKLILSPLQKSRGRRNSWPRRTATRPTPAATRTCRPPTSRRRCTSASATTRTKRTAPTWTSSAGATSVSTSGPTSGAAARLRATPATARCDCGRGGA